MIVEFIFTKSYGIPTRSIDRTIDKMRINIPVDDDATLLEFIKDFLSSAISNSDYTISDEILHMKGIILDKDEPLSLESYHDLIQVINFYGFSFYALERVDLIELPDESSPESNIGRFYLINKKTDRIVNKATSKIITNLMESSWPHAIMSSVAELVNSKEVDLMTHYDEEKDRFEALSNSMSVEILDTNAWERLIDSIGYKVIIILE